MLWWDPPKQKPNMNHIAGKISIKDITNILSKYISKSTTDMKSSPDVCNNPSSRHMQGT